MYFREEINEVPGIVCVCCSGNAGESAGRRGSRIGDLAIPAQVTRGPRSRTSCRNDRTRIRTNSPRASSPAAGERRGRRGTSALSRRRQATLRIVSSPVQSENREPIRDKSKPALPLLC